MLLKLDSTCSEKLFEKNQFFEKVIYNYFQTGNEKFLEFW